MLLYTPLIISIIILASLFVGKAVKIKYNIKNLGDTFIGLTFFYGISNIFQSVQVLFQLDRSHILSFYIFELILILIVLALSLKKISNETKIIDFLKIKFINNKGVIGIIIAISLFYLVKDIVNTGWTVSFIETFDAQYYLSNSAEIKNGIYNVDSFNGSSRTSSLVSLFTYNYGPTVFIASITNTFTSLIWLKVIPVLNWAILIVSVKTLLKLNGQKINNNLLLLLVVSAFANTLKMGIPEISKIVYLANYPTSMVFFFSIFSAIIILIYFNGIKKLRLIDTTIFILIFAVNLAHIYSVLTFTILVVIGMLVRLFPKLISNKKNIILFVLGIGFLTAIYYILSKISQTMIVDVESRHYILIPAIFLLSANIYNKYKNNEYSIYVLTPIIFVIILTFPFLSYKINFALSFGYYRLIIAILMYLLILSFNKFKFQLSNGVFAILMIFALGFSPIIAHNRGYKYKINEFSTGLNEEIVEVAQIIQKNQKTESPIVLTHYKISNTKARGEITVNYIRAINPKIIIYQQLDLLPGVIRDKKENGTNLFDTVTPTNYNDFLVCTTSREGCNKTNDTLEENLYYINSLNIDFIVTSKTPNTLILDQISVIVGETASTNVYMIKDEYKIKKN